MNILNNRRYREPTKLREYDPALRGPPQNRFNGHRTSHIKGLKGNTFGAAGKCRTYTPEKRAQLEEELRNLPGDPYKLRNGL